MLPGNYHLSVWAGRVELSNLDVGGAGGLKHLWSDGNERIERCRDCAGLGLRIILRCVPILFLTALSILLFWIRCCNRRRLSRVAEGTGPLKPQQPGATAKVLIPAQVGRDKILD